VAERGQGQENAQDAHGCDDAQDAAEAQAGQRAGELPRLAPMNMLRP